MNYSKIEREVRNKFVRFTVYIKTFIRSRSVYQSVFSISGFSLEILKHDSLLGAIWRPVMKNMRPGIRITNHGLVPKRYPDR